MRSWLRRVVAGLVVCVGGLSAGAAGAVDESELLPVDEAFALSVDAPAPGRVALHWRIADGYYLYRQRMSVLAVDGNKPAQGLQLPHGDPHHDAFFGDVETYRGAVTGTLAVPGAASATIKVKYQGCADVGVCYPPQTRVLTVALADAGGTDAGDDGLAALGRALGGAAPAGEAAPLAGNAPLAGVAPGGASVPLPLPPEQAFGFEAIVGDGNTLLLRFTPAKGYYLYRDKTSLRLSGSEALAAGAPRWPQGVLHRDEHFGNVVVFFNQVDVPLPLRRTRPDAVDATLTATFQGCQTDGICYPPMTRTVRLAVPAGVVTAADREGKAIATDVAPTNASPVAAAGVDGVQVAGAAGGAQAAADRAAAPVAAAPAQAEDDRLAALLAGPNKAWALLMFFVGGLLLSLTPCVYPMIPILSGLIAGHGTRLGTRRALLLALVFVLSNALVFTAAGVVAGLLGANLQAAFQHRWIIVAFAALFVALALSSFGVYELQLPAALRARLGAASDRQHGGSVPGVAAMGALSALIVGPCVAPPLAAAVLYIGQSHDPVLGGAALFLLALGMGVPLLAFGAAAGRGLPTSGPWMTAVQRVFGFVFLGLAVWMLGRILPATATLALWGALALGAATWTLSAAIESPRPRLAARFAGVLLGVVGAAELLGAMGGGHDPRQPLAGMFGQAEARDLVFRTIKSSADLDREIAAAKAAGRPLLFDFYADWCVSCKEMERDTFTDPAVQAALADVVLLKADVTANDEVDQALMRRFGIIGPPATLFFRAGEERRGLRLVGFEKPAPFVARVRSAAQ